MLTQPNLWILWGYVGDRLWRLEVGSLGRCRAEHRRRAELAKAGAPYSDMIIRRQGSPYRFDIDAPMVRNDPTSPTFSEFFGKVRDPQAGILSDPSNTEKDPT